jgi:hypothetical protein
MSFWSAFVQCNSYFYETQKRIIVTRSSGEDLVKLVTNTAAMRKFILLVTLIIQTAATEKKHQSHIPPTIHCSSDTPLLGKAVLFERHNSNGYSGPIQ